jgi:hypothetical protein
MNTAIMSRKKPTIEAELETLQRESFCYFLHETNPVNGLVKDKSIRGEKGEKGDRGPQGERGEKGDKGDNGVAPTNSLTAH